MTCSTIDRDAQIPATAAPSMLGSVAEKLYKSPSLKMQRKCTCSTTAEHGAARVERGPNTGYGSAERIGFGSGDAGQ